jgi:hypothetical protein
MLAVTSNRSTLFLRDVLKLLITANVVPSSPILVILMMEAILSFETSVLTRAAWRHIPEEGIRHSHFHENLKSYIALIGWALWRICNVSPVRYELGFYIPVDGFFVITATFTVFAKDPY